MKKLPLFFGIFALCLASAVAAYAQTSYFDVVVRVEEKSLPDWDDFAVTGDIPYISLSSITADEECIEFQDTLNFEIEKIISSKLEDGTANRARGISFSYFHETDENIESIVIYTNISLPGYIRQDADSINFDRSTLRVIDINTVLGPNGTKLVNSYLNNVIWADFSKYNPGFSGITESHAFYTDGSSLFLVFDSYEITKGSSDRETIEFPVNLIKNYEVEIKTRNTPDGSFTILFPLREICEQFGFDVKWRGIDSAIEITRDSFTTEITAYVNEYKKGVLEVKLESSPMFIEGSIYVPITFFEEILGLSYYVSEDLTVTFSEVSDS